MSPVIWVAAIRNVRIAVPHSDVIPVRLLFNSFCSYPILELPVLFERSARVYHTFFDLEVYFPVTIPEPSIVMEWAPNIDFPSDIRVTGAQPKIGVQEVRAASRRRLQQAPETRLCVVDGAWVF